MQVWRSCEMQDKNCRGCGQGGSKFMCQCALSTRYCSEACQRKDWSWHRRTCMLYRDNTSTIKVREFAPGMQRMLSVGVLGSIMPECVMFPGSAILILNWQRARLAQANRKKTSLADAADAEAAAAAAAAAGKKL